MINLERLEEILGHVSNMESRVSDDLKDDLDMIEDYEKQLKFKDPNKREAINKYMAILETQRAAMEKTVKNFEGYVTELINKA